MPKHLLILTGVVVLAASGCATPTSHKSLASFLKAHENTVSGTEARVGAADSIAIIAPKILEIDSEARVVRPDGKVSLRLIGEVKVAGLTAREIAAKLKELLAPYYHDPEVQIRILSQPGRTYYVLGQVASGGPQRYTGRDTLMDALVRASPTSIAWKSRVKVIRPSPFEGKRREIEVDVERMVKTGDTRLNVLLEPGDIVYVPPTPLGWIGLKIEEALYPVRPVIRAGTAPAAIGDIPDAYDSERRGSGAGFN